MARRRPIRSGTLGIVVAMTVLSGCGPTFVDESVDPSGSTTTTNLAAIDPDESLDVLLAEVEQLMLGLGQRIVDNEGDEATLERLLEVWAVAEEQIRRDDPTAIYDFRQGIELARTGVERNRPADANKGYLIFADLVANYDAG